MSEFLRWIWYFKQHASNWQPNSTYDGRKQIFQSILAVKMNERNGNGRLQMTTWIAVKATSVFVQIVANKLSCHMPNDCFTFSTSSQLIHGRKQSHLHLIPKRSDAKKATESIIKETPRDKNSEEKGFPDMCLPNLRLSLDVSLA